MVLDVLSSLAIILRRESWLLYFNSVVAVCFLSLFLKGPWFGLQSVIMAFPGHTHLKLAAITALEKPNLQYRVVVVTRE